MSPKDLLKTTLSDWNEDKAAKLAAALAFYTMLSIAPLLTILIKIVSVFFDPQETVEVVRNYLIQSTGARGAEAAEQLMASAGQSGAGIVATIVSVVVLLLSASGVFGELQDSLNTIWEVKPRPGRGFLGTLGDRFFSISLVLGTAFLLMTSLVASAILAALSAKFGGGESLIWQFFNFGVSFLMLAGLFTLIFRFLPDVRTSWRSVTMGGVLTAAFFTVGKFLLGWYLGRESTTNVYGAAASLVALLLWVYYSAQILFFGAEFTRAYAKSTGDEMKPLTNAVPLLKEERVRQGIR